MTKMTLHTRATANATQREKWNAQTYPFPAASFDVVFSRFGTMFFDDRVAAFQNLRSALRRGGRLAFVCWPAPRKNQFVTIPLAAAACCHRLARDRARLSYCSVRDRVRRQYRSLSSSGQRA